MSIRGTTAAHRRIEIMAQYETFAGEMVVDNFAGGGGASHGIADALGGREPDIAINHDSRAIAMHRKNHPGTKHFVSDIWEVDPRDACGGRKVGLAWFSPDCKHFSRAKGDVPRSAGIRSLAWVVIDWAKKVAPRVIILENVSEFETWGPLGKDGKPNKKKAGQTFRQWVSELRDQGYEVEWKHLTCADYGAPTIRKRLFLIARNDGQPITWPAETHSKDEWVPAHECIDWSIPCPSIFTRKRPLAEGTLARIAEGVRRYVLGAAEPFIVRHGHYSKRTGVGLVNGAKGAGSFRGQHLHAPLGTVCATNDKNLVIPHIVKHYGGLKGHQAYGHEMQRTLGTITGRDSTSLAHTLVEPVGVVGDDESAQRALVTAAFLSKYYKSGTRNHQAMTEPLHTVRTKDCFALHPVTFDISGQAYRILDIGMRMLQPRELFNAQGFDQNYSLEAPEGEKRFTQTELIRFAGNSVPPNVAQALVASQA
jgi:DNA (cytosine-5)-methyltransferase 1